MPYAAVYGLVDDTHLHKQLYSWLGSTFYFGYLFMEFPNLWIISKFPVGKYMGACFCAMGICVCLLTACNNFAGLATLRFLQGAFEAAMLPCLLFINSMWYRREEQPLRTALWANTFAGTFTGILSYAIGNIGGPLATWRVSFNRNLFIRTLPHAYIAAVYFYHLRLSHTHHGFTHLPSITRLSLDSVVFDQG